MGKPTHYPLGHEEYLRIRQLLKPRELDVYLYLTTKHPFDDSVMEIDTAEIAENLGYHRRTIQTIVKRLSELELLDVEYTRFKYRTARHGSKSKRVASESNDSFKTNQMTRTSESNDSFKAKQMTRTSESNDSFTTAETQTEQSSGKPSDYSNFIQTLSEDERERFLKFARNKADRLPEPPQLVEKWIVDNHHWLRLEFEKIDGQEPKHSGPGQGSAPPNSDEKNELHPEIEAGLADGRIRNLDPAFNGLYDAEGVWWKVDEWIEKVLRGGDDADAPNDCDKHRSQVKEWLAQALSNNPDDKTEPASLTPILKPQEVS